MAGAKRPEGKRANPEPRFFDNDEREIIESFEVALERGEVRPNTAEELAEARAQWKQIAAASEVGEAVSLRLSPRDLERIKTIARQRGVAYQTLMSTVLHQFAQDALSEAG